MSVDLNKTVQSFHIDLNQFLYDKEELDSDSINSRISTLTEKLENCNKQLETNNLHQNDIDLIKGYERQIKKINSDSLSKAFEKFKEVSARSLSSPSPTTPTSLSTSRSSETDRTLSSPSKTSTASSIVENCKAKCQQFIRNIKGTKEQEDLNTDMIVVINNLNVVLENMKSKSPNIKWAQAVLDAKLMSDLHKPLSKLLNSTVTADEVVHANTQVPEALNVARGALNTANAARAANTAKKEADQKFNDFIKQSIKTFDRSIPYDADATEREKQKLEISKCTKFCEHMIHEVDKNGLIHKDKIILKQMFKIILKYLKSENYLSPLGQNIKLRSELANLVLNAPEELFFVPDPKMDKLLEDFNKMRIDQNIAQKIYWKSAGLVDKRPDEELFDYYKKHCIAICQDIVKELEKEGPQFDSLLKLYQNTLEKIQNMKNENPTYEVLLRSILINPRKIIEIDQPFKTSSQTVANEMAVPDSQVPSQQPQKTISDLNQSSPVKSKESRQTDQELFESEIEKALSYANDNILGFFLNKPEAQNIELCEEFCVSICDYLYSIKNSQHPEKNKKLADEMMVALQPVLQNMQSDAPNSDLARHFLTATAKDLASPKALNDFIAKAQESKT